MALQGREICAKGCNPRWPSLGSTEGAHALIAYLFIDPTQTELTDWRALRAPFLQTGVSSQFLVCGVGPFPYRSLLSPEQQQEVDKF